MYIYNEPLPLTLLSWLEKLDNEYRQSLKPQYVDDRFYPLGFISTAYKFRELAHKAAIRAVTNIFPFVLSYDNNELRGQAFDELGEYPVSKHDVTEFLDIVRENADSQAIIEYGALVLIDGRMDFPIPEPNNTCLFESARQSKKFNALIQKLGARNQAVSAINAYAALQATQPLNHAPAEAPKAIKPTSARPVDKAVAELIKRLGTDKPRVIMSYIQNIAGAPLSDWSVVGDFAVMKGREAVAENGFCFTMTSDGFRYIKDQIKKHRLLP